jgi:hypothetical protein
MLDWVPLKAAQHTQSDAMTRFMPSLEQNPAAAPARRHLQSIRGRGQVLLRAGFRQLRHGMPRYR